MIDPTPERRRFFPTPGWLVLGLLVVEGLLWLSERFSWFGFNSHKGWTVLIAAAVVGGAMLVMLLWFIASLIFRWQFQFSIRSLLVLTVAMAIPCSWLAVEMKEATKQRAAVLSLKRMGGDVRYDYQEWQNVSASIVGPSEPPEPRWLTNCLGDDFFTRVEYLRLPKGKGTDELIASIMSYCRLRGLDLSHCDITDAGLDCLKTQGQLEILWLSDTRVTDAALERVVGSSQLHELYLNSTQITDSGLERLNGMVQLEELELNDTRITNVGLGNLMSLKRLLDLSLVGTKVTDDGLSHLKGLTQLQSLVLIDTLVTEAGVNDLQQALPNCQMITSNSF